MQWQDAIAVLIGCALVFLVARSMFSQWGGGKETPIRGKLRAASEWLEENDYRILRVRQRAEWTGYYDARAFRKQLIADFIVRKGARTYAVKVMNAREQEVSGQRMRDQWQPLVEAFHVNGVLHIDLDREQVHEIDFSIQSPRYVVWQKLANRALWMLLGALAALLWLHGR
ncbi:MAG: hypothetical protein K6T78_06210 [Alicyclobacillus sp.]|nr:hypothetical protein [Alicyclobacillus sp.]